MSKVSHLPKTVPSKEIPFKIKVKGAVNKDHTYEGDFVVRVPETRQMSQMGIELARLNDGVPLEMLDRNTRNINNAIAYLKVNLVKGPAWFVNNMEDSVEEGMDYGLDTLDINVPIAIFQEADKLISKWHKSLRGQPTESPKDESEKA
jgi:hypothetical protein